MKDIDVKILPNEAGQPDAGFEHHHLSEPVDSGSMRKVGEVSNLVKIKFPNFARLVATHSFEDILERNQNEEIILQADLLADLANAELVEDEKKKRYALILAGVVLGILISLVFLGDL